MKLAKWDPLQELEDVFGRYFKHVSRPVPDRQELLETGEWAPRVDIAETDAGFSIKMELPEIKKEDVRITVDNGVLSIRGERRQKKEEKGVQYHRVERQYGSFVRSFSLPDNVAQEQIEGAFKDGVLSLSIPKTEVRSPKQVEIAIK